MKVLKRDGKQEDFDFGKIRRSILMAFPGATPDALPLTQRVLNTLRGTWPDNQFVGVNVLQEIIEAELEASGYRDVAERFRDYRQRRDIQRSIRLTPDCSAVSDYIQVAKYGRFDQGLGRRELYAETVSRVRKMHLEYFDNNYTVQDDLSNGVQVHELMGAGDRRLVRGMIDEAFGFVYEKKVMPSMRSMQFAGPKILKHHESMYNCCFTYIDRVDVFSEIMFLLLCGCGVGYSVQWHHIDRLPLAHARAATEIMFVFLDDSVATPERNTAPFTL